MGKNIKKLADFDVESWHSFMSSSGKVIKFPQIKVAPESMGGIPECHCAMYARVIAKGMFRKDYFAKHAWNLRYFHETFDVEKFSDLRKAYQEGVFRQGHLVGFHNPGSNLLHQTDQTGQRVRYTHIAVLLGEDMDNCLRFGQQIVDERVAATDLEMYKRGFKPREIILPTRI